MTKDEELESYGRCMVCCDDMRGLGRDSVEACQACWKLYGVLWDHGRRITVSRPIPFEEWEANK
jgi:hypothetical protein